MLLIVVMGLRLLPEELGWYHFALLLGLLFTIGGYVALMWSSDKFLVFKFLPKAANPVNPKTDAAIFLIALLR